MSNHTGSKIIKKIKFQLTLFFYAISYFTRIPIPTCIVFDDKQFYKANAYFPIIGLLNALLMVVMFYFCQFFFSIAVSIILMLMGAILLTGALHEDGFADCCDGFGGGYDTTQRLKIMKDSQIGTYGGIGLIMLLLLKFILLVELAEVSLVVLIISLLIAHTLSRYASLCVMQTLPYVRLDKGGKLQVLATKLNRNYFIFASIIAFLCLLLLTLKSALIIIVSVTIITFSIQKLLMKNLSGYTGDCLGFIQQLIELTILLLLSIVFIV